MKKSLDDVAAEMADRLAKGGTGDMPMSRVGDDGAEGGFTSLAGGKPIDADAEKAGYTDAEIERMTKGRKTGSQTTSEPGRQGESGKTGARTTSEPGAETGGGLGEPSQLPIADDSFRSRKSGQQGGQSGSAPNDMGIKEDDSVRRRKMKKAEEMDEEDDEDEEDEEESEKGCKKSGEIDADALIKSLEMLEEIAQGAEIGSSDRFSYLQQGLEAGTLTKSEMVEFASLMKSGDDELDDFEKSIEIDSDDDAEGYYREQFDADEDLEKSYGTDQEISDFLRSYSQRTAAAFDEIQSTLTKSMDDRAQQAAAFNVRLAKSLRGMVEMNIEQGDLVKSLMGRLEAVENTPLPRRGISSATQALRKSISGEVGAGDETLRKSEVMDALEQMAMRGMASTPSGHRIDHSVALIEQNGQLAKSLYSDVVSWRKLNNGSTRVS